MDSGSPIKSLNTLFQPMLNYCRKFEDVKFNILGQHRIKIKITDLFKKLTISTYVSRFNSYNNQIFKKISVERLKENRFLVKTEFRKLEGSPITFNYIVQKNNQKWRIISVIANGINDLSLKRAEYAAIIKKDGFDVLVTKLEQKIRDSQTN